MTTICYKDGIVAYDSRLTANSYIISDHCNKRIERNGVQFFVGGTPAHDERFISAYFSSDDNVGNIEAVAFVVDKGKLYQVQVCDEVIYRTPLALKEPASIGSGADHAITAMDMGADAKTAVKMAAKRHAGTGGRIRTYHIK